MKPSNNGIDIYYFPPSPPSRAVLLLIKALGLNHTVKTTSLFDGDHMKPEFLKMNPLHTIPVINDNGFILYDSHAIMKYLVDQYAKDDHLFPKDPKQGGIVTQRCFFDACYLFPKFVEYHGPVLMYGKAPSKEALKNLEEVLQHLDTFLVNEMYVAGPHLTVADFSIITIISTIEAAGSIDLKQYANIWMWYQRTKKAMGSFDYEHVNQEGANTFGQMFINKISNIN